MNDLFERLPFLPPPIRWHPSVGPLIEEARTAAALLPEDDGLELWAWLGGLTQAALRQRCKSFGAILDLVENEESAPSWPVLARCLLRLASSKLPGRFLAAHLLLELVTDARARDVHRTLLDVDALELTLGSWADEGRRPFRDEIRRRIVEDARAPNYWEVWSWDEFSDHAMAAERAI